MQVLGEGGAQPRLPGGPGQARKEIQLTNFLAKIVADVRYDDGVEENHYFEIEATREGRTVRGDVHVSRFNSLNWVVELLGGRAIVTAGFGSRDRAREAIQVASGP